MGCTQRASHKGFKLNTYGYVVHLLKQSNFPVFKYLYFYLSMVSLSNWFSEK